jgi:4a-hydroxytetrahydrobiopterin dehydratase
MPFQRERGRMLGCERNGIYSFALVFNSFLGKDMNMHLVERQCAPCKEGQSAMSAEETAEMARDIPRWSVADQKIVREFKLKGFREAIEFVNEIADLAEEQDHHPDIFIRYNKVSVTLWTHKVNGLTPNDFIMAAKIGELAGD